MDVKRRSYHSPVRSDRARKTGRQIIAAAEELFASRGFAAVTMDEIARRAKVSPATVYLHYPSKADLVAGLAQTIFESSDLSVERIEQEPDIRAQLRIGASILRELNERSWIVAGVLREARETNEQLMTIWQEWQHRHEAAIGRAVRMLDERGVLRSGLEPDDAVDQLFVLAGTEVYRALIQERGWSPDRYEQWLRGMMSRELLGMEES